MIRTANRSPPYNTTVAISLSEMLQWRSDDLGVLTIATTTLSDLHIALISLVGIRSLSLIPLDGVRSGKPAIDNHTQVGIVLYGLAIMPKSMEKERPHLSPVYIALS